MATKCPKCQLDNPETSRFCADCGTPLVRGHEPNSHEFGIVSPNLPTETLQAPIHELTTGSTFAGRYQVIEELGKGGMGRVYKVLDAEVKEKVALKILKPEIASDEETIERFRNELRFARKISHKNVCRMYDLSREQGMISDNHYSRLTTIKIPVSRVHYSGSFGRRPGWFKIVKSGNCTC